MSMKVNLRHLETQSAELNGEISAEELNIDTKDEVIRVVKALEYDLEVENLDGGLLARGALRLPLECTCVRCLKVFEHEISLKDWHAHVPLEGEDAAPIVNDCVDLTPIVREDILLEFPQHPLCEQECRGLISDSETEPEKSNSSDQKDLGSPAWKELNKLKF